MDTGKTYRKRTVALQDRPRLQFIREACPTWPKLLIKRDFGAPILIVSVFCTPGGHALNPRFRAYLAVVACVALAAIVGGACLEYGGLNAVLDGRSKDAIALTLVGMSVTAGALLALFSAWKFCRRESQIYDRFKSFPDAPWLWKREWESGRIVSGEAFPLTVTAVAVLWVSLSAGTVLLTDDSWREVNREMAWLLPLIPVVGLVLVVAAVRSLLRWRRFGATMLHLECTPVVPGAGLSAVLETGISSAVENAVFRISVTCRREITPDVRRSHTRRDVIVWRDVADFCGVSSHHSPGKVAIPFSFVLPSDLPESSVRTSSDKTVWEVAVTGLDAQNSAYDERFEIPVFVASDDAVAQVSPVSQVYRPERVAAPPAGTIVSPGIEVSSTANEIEVVFRRGRENRLAAILLQFAILWSAVTAVVAYQDVHSVVPILLGTFTVIPLIEAFRLTFVERRIVANARSIDLIRRVGGFERRSHIDTQTIEEIVVTAVADIGMRERYRLAVRTRDGEALSLAERIPDQISAQWIGLQVGSTIGIRQRVRFRGNVAAAAPRGPIRRDRRAVATYSDEAA